MYRLLGQSRKRATVLHADEKQPHGRRCWPRLGAIPQRQQVSDPPGRPASVPDLHERPDEVADHVVEEAGAGDAVDEEIVLLAPGGVVDGSDVVDGDG